MCKREGPNIGNAGGDRRMTSGFGDIIPQILDLDMIDKNILLSGRTGRFEVSQDREIWRYVCR